MTNLITPAILLIFVLSEFKRLLDTKCQENYEQGVIDSTKGFKIELEDSMKKAFRTGIEQGKEDFMSEWELESNEIYRKIVVKK